MTTREDYVEQMKKSLDEWNDNLAKWEEKARSAGDDMRAGYEAQLAALRKQRDETLDNWLPCRAAAATPGRT